MRLRSTPPDPLDDFKGCFMVVRGREERGKKQRRGTGREGRLSWLRPSLISSTKKCEDKQSDDSKK